MYSGRSEQRDGHSPDTVASDTNLGRGSCGPKKTILLPSPFLVLLFPALVYLQQDKKKAEAESKNCHAKTMLSLEKSIKLI
jgi:hypothetical protein